MMKSAALFMLSFSVACAGYLYSRKVELRVTKIQKILLFLSQVKTEIEFTAGSIDTILKNISENSDISSLPFIDICRRSLESAEDFTSAWNSSLDRKENVYALKKEDVAALKSFGALFGITDSSGQLRNCEMHEKLFNEKLNNALNDKKTLCRPVRTVGILTGAALMIIFM